MFRKLFGMLLIIFVGFSFASIDFTSPTSTNNTFTSNTSIEINTSISDAALYNITWNWNDTNYTFYNDSLILFYNFQNLSSLGEDDTAVTDLSVYGFNGSVSNAVWNSSGKYGGAYDFNGVNSTITMPDITSGDICSISIVAWSYRTSAPDTILGGVFSTQNNSNYDNVEYNGTLLRFELRNASIGNSVLIPGNYSDRWIQTVLVLDNGQPYGYINGSLIWSSGSTSLQKISPTDWHLYVNQSKNATAVLDDGLYTYQSFETNTSDPTNQTEVRQITVDTTNPTIYFVSPTSSNNTNTSNTNVTSNLSISESNLGNFTWNWNGTNYTFYDSSLLLLLNLDNLSSLGENSSTVSDLNQYANIGVVSGPVWNSSGKFGGAYTFNGLNDSINFSHSTLFHVQNLTIESWIYVDPNAGTQNTLVSYGWGTTSGGPIDGSGESFALLYNTALESFRLRLKNAAGTSFLDDYNSSSSPTGSVLGQWVFVSATWNGSIAKIYRNGVLVNTAAGSGTINYLTDSEAKLRIGNWFGNDERWFNGSIDEVRIYNRSFSQDEVRQHYYSNLRKIQSGIWNFYSNQSNLSDRIYSYYGYALDLAPFSNQTETRMITVDTTSPAISIASPTNQTNTSNTTVYFTFTPSDNLFSNLSCTLNVSGGSSNSSFVSNNTAKTLSISSLTNGTYSWNVTCNDSATNSNTTTTRIFTVDSVAPTVSLVSPVNLTNTTNTT
ncbi:LamG domain-containing protein, partial [Candidatus Micrarchaeota archaeon]|nr:LamG domain-containing protein [Candidatus Micrarchaeota archaeon]